MTPLPRSANGMKATATGCLIFAVSIAGFGITRAELSEPVASAETDYPELVKLRGQILANAGGDLETYESDLE